MTNTNMTIKQEAADATVTTTTSTPQALLVGPRRTIARPVANLGNTCYMNAVLQALCHAPELCLAVDCEPHSLTCPIAARNAHKHHARSNNNNSSTGNNANNNKNVADGSSIAAATAAAAAVVAGDDLHHNHPYIHAAMANNNSDAYPPARRAGTRKSSRSRGRKSPPSYYPNDNNNNDDTNSTGAASSSQPAQPEWEYCALCELEYHFIQVHNNNYGNTNNNSSTINNSTSTSPNNYAADDAPNNNTAAATVSPPAASFISKRSTDKPVTPSSFVHGFTGHVAPWFRLGLQEDSHEFLRLLIDAMQKSCDTARNEREKILRQQQLEKTQATTTTLMKDETVAALASADDIPMTESSTVEPTASLSAPDKESATTVEVEDSKTGATTDSVSAVKADVSNTTAAGTTTGVGKEPSSAFAVPDGDNQEYPFYLFRGKIRSNVICDSCHASSSKFDPIEDIGLEVTAVAHPPAPPAETTAGAFTTNATASTNENTATTTTATTTTNPSSNSPVSAGGGANATTPTTRSSSRSGNSNSPTNSNANSGAGGTGPGGLTLADVTSAFCRFARAESLDGYKCEKCGKSGKATKQSRLASIPPILTLHLKRFRYGGLPIPTMTPTTTPVAAVSTTTEAATTTTVAASNLQTTGGGAKDKPTAAAPSSGDTGSATAASATSNPPPPSGRTTRSGRSEVNQLLGHTQADFLLTGKGGTGSAKIEGHIRFPECFDLKPFLTDELQECHKNMYCRLFAVVVHAGKNSHSGHYYSFVRNMEKNEWWKMDDGRVTLVHISDVLQAEAYMLFYRVLQHPISLDLETRKLKKWNLIQQQQQQQRQLQNVSSANKTAETQSVPEPTLKESSKATRKKNGKGTAAQNEKQQQQNKLDASSNNNNNKKDDDEPQPVTDDDEKSSPTAGSTSSKKRKRGSTTTNTAVTDFEEWTRVCESLPPHLRELIRKAEEMVADNVQLSAEFFKTVSDKAAAKANGSAADNNKDSGDSVITNESLTVTEDDIVGGAEVFRRKLANLFYMLGKHFDGPNSGTSWLTSASAAKKRDSGGGSGTTTKRESNIKKQEEVVATKPIPLMSHPASAAASALSSMDIEEADDTVL